MRNTSTSSRGILKIRSALLLVVATRKCHGPVTVWLSLERFPTHEEPRAERKGLHGVTLRICARSGLEFSTTARQEMQTEVATRIS